MILDPWVEWIVDWVEQSRSWVVVSGSRESYPGSRIFLTLGCKKGYPGSRGILTSGRRRDARGGENPRRRVVEDLPEARSFSTPGRMSGSTNFFFFLN